MYFGFDLYRDNSIKDLDERLERINSFLAERVSVNTSHRHFGAFLLPPKKSEGRVNVGYLSKRQSKTQYRLCFEFFNDKTSEPIPELELYYNLGETPELYNSLSADVSAISYLCAYPQQEEVEFKKATNSLSILFKFSDTDSNIERIKKHFEFFIPNLSNKNT